MTTTTFFASRKCCRATGAREDRPYEVLRASWKRRSAKTRHWRCKPKASEELDRRTLFVFGSAGVLELATV